MLSKKDAKVRVDQIKLSMAHLLQVPVVVSLGPHEFVLAGIADIHLPALNTLRLVPAKSYSDDTSKQATPQVMQLLFTTGERINLAMDDIESFSVGLSGAVFKIGEETLRIRNES